MITPAQPALYRIIVGAATGLGAGFVAAIVIGGIGGTVFEIVQFFTIPPRPPDDPDGLPAIFSVLAGIAASVTIGVPVGPVVGAIVGLLARFRVERSIFAGVFAATLAGVAAGVFLGAVVRIPFPAWPSYSTVPAEVLVYGSIGVIVGVGVGVGVGRVARFPIPGRRR